MKPSQVQGIDTEAFMRQQQVANNIHEQSILGYRGLVGKVLVFNVSCTANGWYTKHLLSTKRHTHQTKKKKKKKHEQIWYHELIYFHIFVSFCLFYCCIHLTTWMIMSWMWNLSSFSLYRSKCVQTIGRRFCNDSNHIAILLIWKRWFPLHTFLYTLYYIHHIFCVHFVLVNCMTSTQKPITYQISLDCVALFLCVCLHFTKWYIIIIARWTCCFNFFIIRVFKYSCVYGVLCDIDTSFLVDSNTPSGMLFSCVLLGFNFFSHSVLWDLYWLALSQMAGKMILSTQLLYSRSS